MIAKFVQESAVFARCDRNREVEAIETAVHTFSCCSKCEPNRIAESSNATRLKLAKQTLRIAVDSDMNTTEVADLLLQLNFEKTNVSRC